MKILFIKNKKCSLFQFTNLDLSDWKKVQNYLIYLHHVLFSYNFFTLEHFFCNNCSLCFKILLCILWYNSTHGGGKEYVRNLSKGIRIV
ncbi:ArsR family transcriptional regulator [Bacillus pseudomycoides]|nr:ArsR family transcriptional regulator [Bacillus pseudomycoides]